ncbi:MAG TPA: DUF4416 family protein, partial [Candidatus Omnitrophota bacterium]|nr:DUF4416 family protein [Candidatus Omnitrophota bacterium]
MHPLKVLPAKLIIGLISGNTQLFKKAATILEKKYGPIEDDSQIFSFDLTDYYKKEMGADLKRQFITFKKLIHSEKLADIKIFTNRLEFKLSKNPEKRDINIDPGYISLSKLVLATTKSFVHRIYMGKGIFEEVTLYYKGHSFCPGPWTYPDFRLETHLQ